MLNSAAAPIDTNPTTEQIQESHTEIEVETTLTSEPSTNYESTTKEPPKSQRKPTTPFPGFENIKYSMSAHSTHKGSSKTLSKTSNEKGNLKQQTAQESIKLQNEYLLVPSSESEIAEDGKNQFKKESELKRSQAWLLPDEDLLQALTESE